MSRISYLGSVEKRVILDYKYLSRWGGDEGIKELYYVFAFLDLNTGVVTI